MFFLWVGRYAISEIVFVQDSFWFLWLSIPSFLIFFISIVAETNRHLLICQRLKVSLLQGIMLNIRVLVLFCFFG